MLLQYHASNMCFKSTTEECFLLIDSAAELPWFLSFVLFAGGADKNVVVFDKSSEQILATLKGHTKKVTSVVFHPSQVRALDFLQDFSMRKSDGLYLYNHKQGFKVFSYISWRSRVCTWSYRIGIWGDDVPLPSRNWCSQHLQMPLSGFGQSLAPPVCRLYEPMKVLSQGWVSMQLAIIFWAPLMTRWEWIQNSCLPRFFLKKIRIQHNNNESHNLLAPTAYTQSQTFAFYSIGLSLTSRLAVFSPRSQMKRLAVVRILHLKSKFSILWELLEWV